jgi:hypothetical protein
MSCPPSLLEPLTDCVMRCVWLGGTPSRQHHTQLAAVVAVVYASSRRRRQTVDGCMRSASDGGLRCNPVLMLMMTLTALVSCLPLTAGHALLLVCRVSGRCAAATSCQLRRECAGTAGSGRVDAAQHHQHSSYILQVSSAACRAGAVCCCW